MNAPTSCLAHRRFLVRAATGLLIGTLIFFGVWLLSLTWLSEGVLRKLPLPSIGACKADAANGVLIFLWNLILAGGLVALASLVALGRFPYGYVIPWLLFGIYGGMLGTNSYLCQELSGPVPLSVSVLWTRAGFREVAGYLLIAAAFANQFVWRQPSFFDVRVERVRALKDVKMDPDAILGLCAAVMLIGWGAAVEVMS